MQKGYPYLIINDNVNKKKCSETCDGVLSLKGNKCYNNAPSISIECETNSNQTVKNGIRQCFCQNKYYYNNSTKRKFLECLGKMRNVKAKVYY